MREQGCGPDVEGLLRARLRLSVVPSVPEIVLHTAHAGSGLSHLGCRDAPYWAYAWPGGLALARYILDRPETIAGRRVLDLGSGSGLVAIAAAKAGARCVVATDVDAFAMTAMALNAEANAVSIVSMLADMTSSETLPDVDLVLGGDVFYAPTVATRVIGFLDRCRAAGLEVLIGDPWRANLPREKLRPIADYLLRDVGDGPAAPAACPAAVFAYG